MLGNAAVAAGLALAALAAGYVCRSPAVRHAAWVLVLLKLVTPPLVPVPLRVLPASWGAPAQPTAGRVVQIEYAATGADYSPAEVARHAPAWSDRLLSAGVVGWALVVWAAGSVGWFAWQGRRIARFRRVVGKARPATAEVAVAVTRLAKALGIARPPEVMTATGIGSPMLWGWGRGAVVLFPRDLLARLAPEARDTLLAHELAHFLRRDHWVRVLEFAATGLYWWHPAVWLARAGIEAAEEECCDGWVVGGLAASPRRYAEALLATVDFEAELRRPCLPPGACAASRGTSLLRRRLFGIIHAERPRRLPGGPVARALVLAALLARPALQAATPEPVDASREAEVSGSESAVGKDRASADSGPLTPDSGPRPKVAEPRAWAAATAPGGELTVLARDREVILRRPDGTDRVLGPGRPLALAFAPGRERLATAGPGPLVRTWDYDGALLADATLPAAARAVAYTPDGARVLALDAAGGVSVLDADTLKRLAGWSVAGPANSLACAPDGRTVAVAFGSWQDEAGWVEFWSLPGRRKVASYPAYAPVGAARFAPDGRTLIVGGWDGLVSWLALPGGELIAERRLPKGVVATAAFCPDAGTLPLEPPPEPAPPPSPVPPTVPEWVRIGGRLP
jgi:beta-lactamase regulating signal transducer with metallopeptidase domain